MTELKVITRIQTNRSVAQTGKAAAAWLVRICAAGFLSILTLALLFGCAVVMYYSLDPDVTVRVNTEPLVTAALIVQWLGSASAGFS